ncbi:PREDICTED: beta-1,3-galactosyltransferase 1-like isoform X2 [Ceratosolen solmsi marchali]|uniref:Hexosyltransferase n=1 Tax=Ceratosolen solmsi marchali TaxID=326594 RepID=A0AAJ6YFE4_9HYME|nr:PREDICTED: beta-1,3-galactosyltransferase 1-like isoform X2 [Ceratosolen solmsi marchali]
MRLLSMQLPPNSNINSSTGNTKGKISFIKRLALGFIILAGLGLLYVPAYHSAQGQFSGFGDISLPVGTLGGTDLIASIVQLRGWSYNTSRDVSIYIHPENTTVILTPKRICNNTSYLIILICSAVGNINARIAIRNTWGQSDNDTLNSYAADENNLYNDIIQERFYDTYNNLTLKSVMLLKWVISNCDKVRYIMKTDDDMFVNIPTLIKTLRERPKSTGTLIGSLICNAKPITDPKNKWYTPKYMYSDRTYPSYLSGTGYVMSSDVALRLYKAALSIPVLHLEDVYITGLCAKEAGLKPVNHHGFSYIPRNLDICSLRETITAHKVNASNMYTVWNKLKNFSTNCKNYIKTAKNTPVSRISRNIGYFLLKGRIHNNRCI